MADWPTEFFDGELNRKAKEYLAAKSKNAAEKIFKETTEKATQKLVKNPKTLLRLPMQKIQSLLARFSMTAAQREAGLVILRQGALIVARGLVLTGGAIVVIAGVLVAAYVMSILIGAVIDFFSNLGRDKTPHKTTQEWLESSYEKHVPCHPPPFMNGSIG